MNFPAGLTAQLRLGKEHGVETIWDTVRKKWLVLTPEEWVRQHCIAYVTALGYPVSLLSTEAGLITGQKKKRSDLLIYTGGQVRVLVECKAPSVRLSQETFNQAFNYNTTLGAEVIWVTNGLQHFYWDCKRHVQVHTLPLPSFWD